MLNAKPETQKKKVTVAVKLRPATFYTLEGWLLLGGANLPEPSTLASFLENLADTWARDVINQNPAEAGQLHPCQPEHPCGIGRFLDTCPSPPPGRTAQAQGW